MQGKTTEKSCSSSPGSNNSTDPLSNISTSHSQAPAGRSDHSTIPTSMLI